MDMKKSLKLCESLSVARGVSGFEDDVLSVLRAFGDKMGSFEEDSLRNLYLSFNENKNDGRPVVQLDAHTDEVGFMVQAIRPCGTLRFITMGGWVSSNIPAHKVWVRNADGDYISGIISSKPPHFMTADEKKKPLTIEDLSIDVGASSDKEAIEDFHIRIGEPVVPAVSFEYVREHDLMFGKAFDDRLGCAAILLALDLIKGKDLKVDVKASFSSEEEVGGRGAIVSARRIRPNISIVFEGCPADDTFSEPYMIQTAIHKGPMLRHIDAGMITNHRFQRYALELAKSEAIPVQESVRSGGFTNGASIYLSNCGVPTIVIGIPSRYIHTHYSIASLSDVVNSAKLTARILENLDSDLINSF